MSINKDLKSEILEMVKLDQETRKKQGGVLKKLYKKFPDKTNTLYKKEINKLVKQMEGVDYHNTLRMKKIIKKFGWPGNSLVGKRGSYAAWLIIQHAVHDRAFQKHCLKLLKEATKNGEADIKNLAYLTDRILVFENKKQIYGTQFKGNNDGGQSPFPIFKPEELDKRRKEVGLESFNKYKKKMEGLG